MWILFTNEKVVSPFVLTQIEPFLIDVNNIHHILKSPTVEIDMTHTECNATSIFTSVNVGLTVLEWTHSSPDFSLLYIVVLGIPDAAAMACKDPC